MRGSCGRLSSSGFGNENVVDRGKLDYTCLPLFSACFALLFLFPCYLQYCDDCVYLAKTYKTRPEDDPVVKIRPRDDRFIFSGEQDDGDVNVLR